MAANNAADSRQRRLLAHRALAEASRVRILEELERSGPLDAAQLATRLGLHHNTVRAHLDLLLEAGLVSGETEHRTTPGRPRTLYRTAPRPPAAQDSGYRLLAAILTSYLAGTMPEPGAVAAEAGRAWGRYLVERSAPFQRLGLDEALRRLVRMLGDLGFAPEAVEGTAPQVLLRHCPFRELAQEHREVVCAVHLGLIQGALAELDAPLVAVGLDPFVEPTLCVARFAGSPAGAAGDHIDYAGS